ncbi:peroxynitrite isomerase THAP4-like [Rhopalosiphum padi]|uniref:peroxynitrite isomerase THAP4-like n=1 Tax=Rhopalosiphum padi TaxID=40932 RepID=UPI00298E0D09|nr:peroxynitrite isomerase THAP4-like [Rhopalosiphum padi]
MATTNKHKGGSVCAVSTCVNYSGKLKQDGISNISFHRFPKNSTLQKEWILKCKRADNWNPSSSFICSAHFKDDEFIRDLQAELLGYAPKGRRLIPDVIPSLNLPGPCIQGNQVSHQLLIAVKEWKLNPPNR